MPEAFEAKLYDFLVKLSCEILLKRLVSNNIYSEHGMEAQ